MTVEFVSVFFTVLGKGSVDICLFTITSAPLPFQVAGSW